METAGGLVRHQHEQRGLARSESRQDFRRFSDKSKLLTSFTVLKSNRERLSNRYRLSIRDSALVFSADQPQLRSVPNPGEPYYNWARGHSARPFLSMC